jgi:hypothetical protein
VDVLRYIGVVNDFDGRGYSFSHPDHWAWRRPIVGGCCDSASGRDLDLRPLYMYCDVRGTVRALDASPILCARKRRAGQGRDKCSACGAGPPS